jgi:hypothetical protein
MGRKIIPFGNAGFANTGICHDAVVKQSAYSEHVRPAPSHKRSRKGSASMSKQDFNSITRYNVMFTGIYTRDKPSAIASIATYLQLGPGETQQIMQAGKTLKSYSDKSPADRMAKQLALYGAKCKVALEIDEDPDDEYS